MSQRQPGPALNVELVVVGAGAAGLYTALCAAEEGARVALVSSSPLAQIASYWAQGGLAAVLAAEDGFERHLQDTERAGRGAVRHSAAEVLVREAPEHVAALQELGIRFDTGPAGEVALGLEGGHSVRRVVHAGGSATGRRLLRHLSALAVQAPLISVLEGDGAHVARLIERDGRCCGVACADGRSVNARAVVLSTGGAAALWARTTNPPGSQGAGLMLALAAGAVLADLELTQFHPTAVTGIPGREGFLITEAIRGEGAILLDADGERFVDELAGRDEVTRAIHSRLRASGTVSVGLDMRAIDPALFPNVVGALRDSGVDPVREVVPVAPAAHYTLGGVRTDLHARTSVAGLYAVGEVACTGLHGANRLASNSLSECFVFGRRAALAALEEPSGSAAAPSRDGQAPPNDPLLAAVTLQTRQAMWLHAGIERTADGLTVLLADPHPLARLIARSALERRETRGVHARADFPTCDVALDRKHLVLDSEHGAEWESWD